MENNADTFKKQSYKEYFKNKKVTMLGLGLLGRGLNDAKFLAECGADLTVTDLKNEIDLKPTLDKLKKYKNIKYSLGGHGLEDFINKDFILKASGIPLDSLFIAEARKNNIPIEMDESLFCKLMPEGVKVIGITGTRGKTTTTYLIYEILKLAEKELGGKIYLGGNIKGLATLPLLKKVKSGDIVVMELSSWQLQGFGEAKISPHISVFTNLMNDHLNYYKGSMDLYFSDKKKICDYHKKEDFLICGQKISKKIKSCGTKIVTNKNDIPKEWKLKIKGEHNLENIACAMAVAKVLKVDEKIIKKAVENFGGVEGRQEFVCEYKGVKIYNDTTSTTPDATIVALKSLVNQDQYGKVLNKNIVLIMGGSDKNLDMSGLVREIPKYCKSVILLNGTGTKKVESLKSKVENREANNLKDAIRFALEQTKRGDVLLFSPAFASFGMFKNEFDRGDKFIKIIKYL
jgi:UDP-N-acetylmuramoylalanine--D-glutamate ligase